MPRDQAACRTSRGGLVSIQRDSEEFQCGSWLGARGHENHENPITAQTASAHQPHNLLHERHHAQDDARNIKPSPGNCCNTIAAIRKHCPHKMGMSCTRTYTQTFTHRNTHKHTCTTHDTNRNSTQINARIYILTDTHVVNYKGEYLANSILFSPKVHWKTIRIQKMLYKHSLQLNHKLAI